MKHNSIGFVVIIAAAMIFGLWSSSARAGDVWLDSLDLGNIEQGWGKPHANQSVDGHALSIGGKQFQHGVGTHVDSEIDVALEGQGVRFTAEVGIDDEKANQAVRPVEFKVVGDGKDLWSSGAVKAGQAPKKVDVDLSGIKTLVLLAQVKSDDVTNGHVDWADAKFQMKDDAQPRTIAITSPSGPAVILTPKPAAEPRINGARVYGERPGRPFLFTIPATGDRPMTFAAEGLPDGLKLDEKTGRITGKVDKAGEFNVTLKANNARGSDAKPLKIVIGNQIALTPPMGWNSWNCWARAVDQEKVLASAKAMVDKGLINHGWTYINIDDTWQGKRGGEFNGIQPNEKFPDIHGLTGQIHAMGLKAGIYSTPWKTSYGHYIGGSSDSADGAWEAPPEGSKHKKGSNYWSHGKHSFATNDAKQWAAWGFDYLKYDWNPNDVPHVKEMSDALRDSGRDLVYSLSNSAPFDHAADWAKLANCWRTTGDIRDTWKSMSGIGFKQDRWAPFAGPGHWNDPDMLVVGYVGWGPNLHPTRLTPDEQYTHISLWCMLSAPLLIGCDMSRLDDFTVSLLSNDEVLAIDQDALGREATSVASDGDAIVYAKDLSDGSKAVGLFNRGRTPMKVTAKWSDVGVSGKQIVRDLWRQKDVGTFEKQFQATVPPHGVVLARLRAVK
jgi:alpha-galactosidase